MIRVLCLSQNMASTTKRIIFKSSMLRIPPIRKMSLVRHFLGYDITNAAKKLITPKPKHEQTN